MRSERRRGRGARWWRGGAVALFALGAAGGVALGLWLGAERLAPSPLTPSVAPSSTDSALRLAPSPEPAPQAPPSAGQSPTAAPPPDRSASRPALAPPIAPEDRTPPPAWLANAVPSEADGRPMLAIVLDDMGVARRWSERAVALPGPLTLAYLPYAEALPEQTAAARQAGHELMVHIAMEPDDPTQDTGPNALLGELGAEEIQRRLRWALSRFDGYVGVNNHMGSRFTRDAALMGPVLETIGEHGLMFLDSRTTGRSVAARLARLIGVPAVERDVFLDNEADVERIIVQLEAAERLARRRGYAVAIGHPRPATLTALDGWLPDLAARGVALVPLSAIARRVNGLDVAVASRGGDGKGAITDEEDRR